MKFNSRHLSERRWLAGGAMVMALAAVGIPLSLRGTARHAATAPKPEAGRYARTVPAPLPSKPTDLDAFVKQHRHDPDPVIQDRVGAARIRLAYDAAKHKDWTLARTTLLTAAHEYKGTGATASDFGGVPDQAKYQAAACLMAEGKKDEARAEFLKFLKEEQLSPLCHAAYRRLVMLNDNQSTPELENLLQQSVAAREKYIRFETSVCGPRCIEHVLREKSAAQSKDSDRPTDLPTYRPTDPPTHRPTDPPTYKAIALLCGTTDSGTTIEGMQKGLKALGYESYAYKLNRTDLEHAPMPAILLVGDHYVVLEKQFLGKATYYDPFGKLTYAQELPKDPTFSVDAILFKKPGLSATEGAQ